LKPLLSREITSYFIWEGRFWNFMYCLAVMKSLFALWLSIITPIRCHQLLYVHIDSNHKCVLTLLPKLTPVYSYPVGTPSHPSQFLIPQTPLSTPQLPSVFTSGWLIIRSPN
jgi:hypothetical protein